MKVLIVDDQADTRNSLIRLCERRNDVQVVGEAACGTAAIDAAGPLNPDIVLLGVELPDMSGFDLLQAVAADLRPLGIMASNYADQATRAFDEGAFDYLVMPVAAERFDRAMQSTTRRLPVPWRRESRAESARRPSPRNGRGARIRSRWSSCSFREPPRRSPPRD